MAGHDAADSRRNRRAKGNQLDAFEPLAIAGNGRERDVRIHAHIAVSGKMFRGREAAIFLHAAHERRNETRHAQRIFAEGAHIDDRIIGIVVHVGVRRENPLNSRGARFERRDFADGVGVLRISGRRDGHRVGKPGAFIEAHGGAALEIRAETISGTLARFCI